MAIFTKAEDLFELFDQSVGGNPIEGGNVGYETKRIFQPEAGLDVEVKNPSYLDTADDEFPTGVVNYIDRRRILGTITLNDRDWWENSNFNEQSFQPYLTDEKKIVFNQEIRVDGNGDEIIVPITRDTSPTYKFTIDAIPFVINPNTNEIIRLDRYYDKEIDSEKYSLATEGKINYYILPRGDNRTPGGNIDTYGYRGLRTSGGENRFDVYADDVNSPRGYHLFRLDWGDGTPLEHTRETKVLEGSTLLEHVYQKPGFYTIKGVVMVFTGSIIGCWEKFETNILINASPNYDVDLFDYKNFATIGGISPDSVLVKSAADIIGVNPLTLDDSKASSESIENINLFDRLNLFNFFTKIDFSILNKFYYDFQDYTKEIYDEPGPEIVDGEIIGCMDVQASNYDPNAQRDITNGTVCEYNVQFIATAPSTEDINLTITFYFINNLEDILSFPPENVPIYNEPEDTYYFRGENPSPDNLNPSMTPKRKEAYQSALGNSWIDTDKIVSNSTKKYIYTNPSNSSQMTTTISKSELLDVEKVLVSVRGPQGGQSVPNVEVTHFSFDIEPVPHPNEETTESRLLPDLSSNDADVYDNVSAVQTVDYNPTKYFIVPNTNPPTDSYYVGGYDYNIAGGGNINDWSIEFDRVSFLELDVSGLQAQGVNATNLGGINGTFNIAFNVEAIIDGSETGGGNGLPDRP